MNDWQTKLGPGEYRRTLWDSLPMSTFINLRRLESFRTKGTAILLKVHTSISKPFEFQPIGELPFGSLQLVTCGGVATAYLLFAPSCKKFVGRNYAALMLRGKPPAEMRRIYIDSNLLLLGDDTAMVATFRSKRWIEGK